MPSVASAVVATTSEAAICSADEPRDDIGHDAERSTPGVGTATTDAVFTTGETVDALVKQLEKLPDAIGSDSGKPTSSVTTPVVATSLYLGPMGLGVLLHTTLGNIRQASLCLSYQNLQKTPHYRRWASRCNKYSFIWQHDLFLSFLILKPNVAAECLPFQLLIRDVPASYIDKDTGYAD